MLDPTHLSKLSLCLWPCILLGCSTAGSTWMREAYASGTDDGEWDARELPTPAEPGSSRSGRNASPRSRTLGQVEAPSAALDAPPSSSGPPASLKETGRPTRRTGPKAALTGKVLGTFRNTYYDFPSETDFSGDKVALYGAQCKPIAQVARGFYEAVCVQGSGLLANGSPVSFNRRDCECAEVCPRTQQRICFDALDLAKFPWGRGATGQAITPLLTVAVDSNVVPLGTPIYIPEYDGLPRDLARSSLHDGCFIAQDHGLRVQGQHVDLFTGQRAMTDLWNGLVPSNSGVTIVLDSPQCARASD